VAIVQKVRSQFVTLVGGQRNFSIMYRSKSKTRELMWQQEAQYWLELYFDYEEWAWSEVMIAKQYMKSATPWEAGFWDSIHDIVDFVQEDDVLDILVGGTDGKVYLLHNIQAVSDRGESQLFGIIGKSFTSNYKRLMGAYSVVDEIGHCMPLNGAGQHANRLWINHELTLINNRQSEPEGQHADQAVVTSNEVSLWARKIQYHVNRVLAYDPNPMFTDSETNDFDDDDNDVDDDKVKRFSRSSDLEIFPSKSPTEQERTRIIFLCPRFLTNYIMYYNHTDAGMDIKEVYNHVLHLSNNVFALRRDNEESKDPNTVAWNAAAYIWFKSSFEKCYNASEKQPNKIYSFSFQAISSAQNAQLQLTAGQQNGIPYLADIKIENKENMLFLSNE
jgi:hypothetical protein